VVEEGVAYFHSMQQATWDISRPEHLVDSIFVFRLLLLKLAQVLIRAEVKGVNLSLLFFILILAFFFAFNAILCGLLAA